MTLPNSHPPLVVDGVSHDMSHLNESEIAVPGKGREPGTDLRVLIKYSNHVATERALHGQPYHTVDHRGTKRAFDDDRYTMSLRLPALIGQGFPDKALCFVSRDFGGHENLIMIKLENRKTWSIVFCFQPLPEGVVMEILSTHPRPMRGKPRRNHLTYFARKCLFSQTRVPKRIRVPKS